MTDPQPGSSDSVETPFRRLHPLTPVLRGWAWLAALGAVSFQQLQGIGTGALFGLFASFTPVAAAYGIASWWLTRYRISAGDLSVESGLLMRRSRRIRLDRLQAVEVVRPLLARALGLAELRLEVVGGTSAEAPLAYLSETEAHRLRAELLARAAGLAADEPEAPERLVLEVPGPRLLASVLLRPYFLIGLMALAFVAASAVFEGIVVVGLVPFLLVLVGPFYASFVKQFGFTVASSPDGVRLRAGLLDTRAQTVPPGRVQAVLLTRPWVWRLFTDWVRLDVNIAGYSGERGRSSAVLLPVATPAEARVVLALVLPEFDLDRVPLAVVPRRARWVRPWGWQRLKAGSDDLAFVTEQGLWRRQVVIVPHGKAQSVRLTQGPWQRRQSLVTLHVDSTPGPAVAYAPHRDPAEAGQLLREEVERSRAGRAGAIPEQWMTGSLYGVPPASP